MFRTKALERFGQVLTLALCLAAMGWAQSLIPPPKLIVFDAPGAGTKPDAAPYEGTFPFRITPEGAIVGDYVDSSGLYHGFLRAPGGAFTAIDFPGAVRTWVVDINPLGVIAGYSALGTVGVGFLRTPDGSFTAFHIPGASAVYPASINLAGEIVGSYVDSRNVNHGFERAPDGAIATFDAPGAGVMSGQGTVETCINLEGAITGYYTDASGGYHGFLRTPEGNFTSFDAPSPGGTRALSINLEGAIVGGSYEGTSGFLRAPNGALTSILPVSTAVLTSANSINAEGVIVGSYIENESSETRAFVRSRSGEYAAFTIPGSGFYGTVAVDINFAGIIVGSYADTSDVYHGYMLIP